MAEQYRICEACKDRPEPDPECYSCNGTGTNPTCLSPDAEDFLDVIQEIAIENAALTAENERLRLLLKRAHALLSPASRAVAIDLTRDIDAVLFPESVEQSRRLDG